MDKNDFNSFSPYDNTNFDTNDMFKDPMFNPMMQYEQTYMYYRCLCMQIEYKIKCKEYEKLCSNNNSRTERKVE